MNKKNIYPILAGILLIALQFNVNFGTITIDLFNDVVAYLLILYGLQGLSAINPAFHKVQVRAGLALAVAILCQVFYCLPLDSSYFHQRELYVLAFGTICALFVTYHFNNAIIQEAKLQEKAAVTRNMIGIWAIFSLLLFLNYIVFMANVASYYIIAQAATVIYAIYYCSYVSRICTQLYMTPGSPDQQ